MANYCNYKRLCFALCFAAISFITFYEYSTKKLPQFATATATTAAVKLNPVICYESPYIKCGNYDLVNKSYEIKFGKLTQYKVNRDTKSLPPGLSVYKSKRILLKTGTRTLYNVRKLDNSDVMVYLDLRFSGCPYANCVLQNETNEQTDLLIVSHHVRASTPLPRRWPHQVSFIC